MYATAAVAANYRPQKRWRSIVSPIAVPPTNLFTSTVLKIYASYVISLLAFPSSPQMLCPIRVQFPPFLI